MSSGADTDSDHQRRRRAVRSNRRGRPGRRQEDDEDENKEQGCCSASSCGLSVHVAILLVFVLCVAGLGGYVRYWYVRGLRTTHTHTLQPSTGLERPYDRGDRGAHVEPEHTNLVLEFSGMDRKKLSDVPMPNLIMTKVHKVGGSTLGGVLRRISHNRGVEGYSFGKPQLVFDDPHEPVMTGYHMVFEKLYAFSQQLLHKKPIFYVTALREPRNRCISQYYYSHFTRGGMRYRHDAHGGDSRQADVDLIRYCSTPDARDHMYNYIKNEHTHSPAEALDLYNVVIITERFNEGIVAMTRLLGVSLVDAVYTKAKSPAMDASIVKHPSWNEASPAVKGFFSSDAWLNDNANDLILYAMAEARMTKLTAELSTGNVRLNSTHQIPYKHAETQFKEWIRALAVCQMAHRDNPHPSSNALAVVDVETGERVVAVPWTPTLPSHKVGTPANTTTEKQKDARRSTTELKTKKDERECYWKDNGCFIPCINRMLFEMGHTDTLYQW